MEVLTAAQVDHLATLLDAGALEARLLTGGRSNLTFVLIEREAPGRRWALRLPPRSGRTPSAHDVAREFRVTSALVGTAVPVPTPVVLVEDDPVLDDSFAVWEFVDGRTVQTATDLADLGDDDLASVVDQLLATLADLHAVEPVVPGLGAARPGFAARQVRRWAAQWDLVGVEGALDRDVRRLASSLVEATEGLPPERSAVVHGDYRIDNVRLSTDGPPRIAAVLDWEMATLGDPTADVALMCTYRDPALDLIIGDETAWTSPRLPGVDRLAAAYEAASGRALQHWDVHLAVGHLKLAVIAAGIDHRARLGGPDGPGFDTAAQAVPVLIGRGLELVAPRGSSPARARATSGERP